ncbi:uncharacterized protein LOC143040425 isoform X2 [Oratosquilla oratoria]|uniref:uncharacterized protein LOC143040425 isoform X2 n=1 Tax=Oratosquilla oratoria TaxID=337810 RepID=UPI003F7588FD
MGKVMQEEEEDLEIGEDDYEIGNPVADKLKSLLGNTLYDELLKEEEKLSNRSHMLKRSKISQNVSIKKLHTWKKKGSDSSLSKTSIKRHQCRYCFCFFKKACALVSHLKYCKWARIGCSKPKNKAASPVKIATSLPAQDQTFRGRDNSATLSDTSSEPRSELHLKSHQCRLCHLTLKTQQALISHSKACKRRMGKPIKCDNCHRIFKKLTALKSHLRACKWPQIYPGKNKNIDTSLKTETSLPLPNQPLENIKSKESLPETPSELSRIQDKNLFQCDLCALTFTKIERFKSHLESCKMEETDLTNPEKETDSVVNIETKWPSYNRLLNRKPFQCTYCGVAFKIGKMLLCHSKSCSKKMSNLREVIFSDQRKTATEEQTQIDRIISTSLKENTGMIVDRPLRCPFCRKTYETQNSLNMHIDKHMKENPEEVRPFSCALCKATFLKVRNLRGHIMTHEPAKPYKCDYCSSSFRNLSYLKVHHRSHTGEKPFKCSLCDAAFARSDSLTIHIRNHSDLRPYQ